MMIRPKIQSNKMQTGLSLIEVLVVLVIIVIGILAVVQLFPSGFGVMHASENASAADRLAQNALESMKQNGSPDGVYASAIDASLSLPAFDPTIPPDDLTSATSIAGVTTPTTATTPPTTDVDKIRYIHNETFTITATHTVTTSGGPPPSPIHVLNFGPIYVSNPTSTTNPAPDLIVNSTNWTAITGNSAPNMTAPSTTGTYPPIDVPSETLVPGQSDYMIDYTNGMIAVPAENATGTGYDQQFIFTVTAGTTVQTVHIVVPGPSSTSPYDGTTWFGLGGGSGSYIVPTTQYPATSITGTWVPGTASLYRPLVYKAPGSFDNDPYEFNLNEKDELTGSKNVNPTLGNFNVGVLAFNQALAYQQGTQAITVQASYTAYDWHVIHEDRELAVDASSSSGSDTIRLAIGDIKQVGDVQTDGTTSSGVILGQGSTAANQYDFIFLNTDTGAMDIADNHSVVVNDDTNAGGTGTIHVSFRNGRLTLPMPLTDSTGATIQHLRIFYRGTADWAVAVQRAPSQYVSVTSLNGFITASGTAPYFNSATALVPGAPGAIIAPTTTIPPTPNVYYYNDAPTSPTKYEICFPLCDENKTIALSNVVVNITEGTQSANVSIPTVELGNDLTSLVVTKTYEYYDLSGVPAISTAVKSAYTQAGITPGTGEVKSISFTGVSGETARAVVIWRDQNVWKQHTLDSILQHS